MMTKNDEVARVGAMDESTDSPTASPDGRTASIGQHTPGPWVYESGPYGDPDVEDCEFLIAEQRDRGDVVGTIVGPIHRGTCEANARLIAAAPELLAVVKGVVDRAGRRGILTLSTVDLDEFRAAIAKAESH